MRKVDLNLVGRQNICTLRRICKTPEDLGQSEGEALES